MKRLSAGHSEAAKLLIEAGANIDGESNRGLTPLMLAVTEGGPGMGAFLLSLGAQVDARSRSDATALIWAARIGELESIQLLVTEIHAKKSGSQDRTRRR